MQKLKLEVDSLVVQSFHTVADNGAGRGTVLGRADKDQTYEVGCQTWDCPATQQNSCYDTCGDKDTCWQSCDLTCHTCMTACFASCGGTCPATCPYCAAPTHGTET